MKEYMKYKEKLTAAEASKKKYLHGIERLIDRMEQESAEKRKIHCADLMNNKEKHRRIFAELLGWPLTEVPETASPKAKAERIACESSYTIDRMQFTVMDDFVITGLLFRHPDDDVRPFVIAQHGGEGTPELISGLYATTGNYNHMVERLFFSGANVFAPQLLLWSQKHYRPDYDRNVLDAKLKNLGSSVTALEVYGIMRILDYFETQTWVGKIGMVGLSYGGFYTQFAAALDTRIKAAISCSFFCEAMHYVKPDWSFRGIADCIGEAELACLVHPRKLFLEMGNRDSYFDYRKSIKEYERIQEICGDGLEDWLEFTVFDGEHEFYLKEDHINKLMEHLRKEGNDL